MSKAWIRFFFWLYLLFLVVVDGTVTNPADPDLWHRLALGEWLWQTGHFPAGGTFSYLADYAQIGDHEWGSAIIFYKLFQWAGPNVFVAVKLVTLALTLTLLVLSGLQNRRPTMLVAAYYALVLLALLPSFQSTVRCMTFTHIFFALWLYWFQCERNGRIVPTYFYVVTMIVWANLHGGFSIGLLWLVLVIVVGAIYPIASFRPGQVLRGLETATKFPGERLFSMRRWVTRLVLCVVATQVNPFGLQLWITTGRALLTTRAGFAEWAPVSWVGDPLSYPGYKILFLAVLIVLGIQIYRYGWRQVNRPIIILIGLFMMLSLTSARHTSLFAVVVGVLLPGLFPREPDLGMMGDPIRRLGYMGVTSMLLLLPFDSALMVLPGAGFQLEYPHVACPIEGVGFLRRHEIRGNLLVPFNYGSYALWELRGRMRVSMDGRYDLVYRPETYRRVEDFFQAEGDWKNLLTMPAPDAILVPVDAPVFPRLRAQAGWSEAWHDDTDAVFLPSQK